ncbi:NepR family anti-sigma factor [Microvirga guangxiensis]|uniref:Anti-sigma factor NepR domain-containing protein n=1 Tax=Microvirga guangxiensis TaxID=549386 RepID=A0A1G5LG88_9HYPH|nr:NepR family anti-sigma factor [Microvirga guangxiensis]SCZ11260.1 hypothetical protein SAMN02927923_04224 [Microvirga guangxiensis]
MPKRLHPSDGPPHPASRHTAWSIGSNGLTTAGQSELLRNIGRQLQADYQDVLREPAPDRIRELLERLESRNRAEEDLGGEDL